MNDTSLRHIILSILMTSFILPVSGQETAGSNIVSRTLLQSDGSKAIEQRVYDNGLGDIVQEVQSYPGSTLPSVIVHHEYDEHRRKTKNGRIDKYQFDEGYCQAEKNSNNTSQDDFTFCYYDRDHLGNIRQVTKASGSKGTVIQTMNYYPFGAQFCDGSACNSDVQSRKYNGKEFDQMHGLNTYDYGARQYDPILARWDRVDPLAEKYYPFSPYSYCAGDPVNKFDPDGMDVWNVDNQGYIVSHTATEEYDQINCVNDKGEIGTSVQFTYGMVSHKTVKSSSGDYEMFTIDGDKNGCSIFEMLAQNADVEWTLGQFGKEGVGTNRITTSHSDWSESGMNSYLYTNPSQVMELRNKVHNHPNGNPDPSFTSKNGGIGGDMAVLQYFDKYYPNNKINYAIYTLCVGTWGYYPYDKNTSPTAISGKQTELREIIVSGTKR